MNNDDIKKQLAKLRRNKRLLWLGIMFFVMIVLWILTSIFAVTKTSSISPELRELAKSFVPRLESKVFDEIASKRAFDEEELSNFPIYIIDKKATDIDGNAIDIISSGKKDENLTPVTQENTLIVEDEKEPVATETTSTSINENEATSTPTPVVTKSVNQDSGYLPIPLEAIIGPQN